MKNNLVKLMVVSLVVSSVSLSGCETLKKKFTRPPKEHKKSPISVPEEGGIQTYPNSILYQSHYVLWKCWQDELINSLGGNHKKALECAQGAASELRSMKRLLNEEGRVALEPAILELESLVSKVENDNLSFSVINQLKSDLAQHKTRVEKKFHYHKITNWIKPDQNANEQ